jgi:hypothetical protein
MKTSFLSLFPLSLVLFFLLSHARVYAQTGGKGGTPEKEASSAGRPTKRHNTISKRELKNILAGKRDYFFTTNDYAGDFIHDDLKNKLAFKPGTEINITEWVIKNYHAGNKYIKIYLEKNNEKPDIVLFTINLKKLRGKYKKRTCPEIRDTCCTNCLEVNSRTFIMDMCNEEACQKTKRPMLIASGRCVRNNELKIGNNQLLSFVIKNNNPLKYELELDRKEVSFNTDHTDFDKAVAGLGPTNKETGKEIFDTYIVRIGSNMNTLLSEYRSKLETLESLIKEVQGYINLKSAESCIDESEVKKEALKFVERYDEAFEHVGAEALLGRLNSAVKSQTLTPDEDKKYEELLVKKARLVPDGDKLFKELVVKLLSMSTTYALLPIQVNDDGADVIEIAVKRKNLLTNVSEEYTYDFRVRGGVKIDFSAGPFLSLLKDEKFTTKDETFILTGSSGSDSTVTRRIIHKQGSGDFSYMFGSLMHIYLRSGALVNGSLSLGAAVSLDQRAVLIAGGSLLLGRQQRFCINGGMAFSNVKRLAAPYSIGDAYEASGDVPLVEQYLSGFVFGFSYNLSKPKVVANAPR